MLNFFKPRPSSKKATAASNGHIDNKSGNTKVAGSAATNRSTGQHTSSNLKTTKASVKQTTADKKRKKDEVVTNGGSNKSPPPKKRIEDNCEKDEVSNALKNASSCTSATTSVTAASTSATTASGGTTSSSTAGENFILFKVLYPRSF